MSCSFPLRGYYSTERNPSGRRSIVFRRADGFEDRPVDVPCGKCEACLADRARIWAVRCYHESQQHLVSSFATLTYDDAHLPSDGKISKYDLQCLFKRLRSEGYRFRYLACGEYGELTRRPHYHVIFFGEDFVDEGKIAVDATQFIPTALARIWAKGSVVSSVATFGSMCYVAGYVHKKVGDEDTFRLGSRRPGIGFSWLDRYYDDIARTGSVYIDNRSIPVPSVYLTRGIELGYDFAHIKRARRKAARDSALIRRPALRPQSREINKRGRRAASIMREKL